jgi:hypothetical protein
VEVAPVITALCRCGKQVFGSEAMAGQWAQCLKCGNTVTFPAPRRLAAAAAPAAADPAAGPAIADLVPPAAPAAPGEAAPAAAPRLPCEVWYWVLLVALVPLVSVLFQDDSADVRKRAERALEAHPEIKDRVERMVLAGDMDPEEIETEVFKMLPGQRLDSLAHLPRHSRQHLLYAGASAAGFFVVVGLLMARRAAAAWQLVLAAAFTATFGVGFLLLFHDFVGAGAQLALEPDRSFMTNLLGFVFVVGLGEELCKSLPVIFYTRTIRNPTWRGACLWGMASGVGFGLAEGILYSAQAYNGIAPAGIYLLRFASCVALHAVWSGSVGITVFLSRRLVGRVIAAVFYGGDFTYQEVMLPLLRVLGVAMVLHGPVRHAPDAGDVPAGAGGGGAELRLAGLAERGDARAGAAAGPASGRVRPGVRAGPGAGHSRPARVTRFSPSPPGRGRAAGGCGSR